jgi:chromosome partitioning protein
LAGVDVTQTIAIVNEKGGTGKTTTAVNLSAALGEMGQRVLLVDLDGQAASSRWLGVEDDTRFADALWKGEAFEPIFDIIPGVSLAPGSGKLDSVAHDLRPTQGGQLRKVLSLMPGFDRVIIDCPPSLGNRLIGNAMLASSHAIVPVEVSILALDGLRILLTTFQDVRDGFGHEILLAGVLACRYDARTKLSRFVLGELQRALPGKVFRTVIRENIRMRECPGSGKSILAYAPDSHAAEDYRALAHELLAGRLESAGGDAEDVAGEISDQERQAIREMRGQISALLHHSAPRGAVATAVEEAAGDGTPRADAAPCENNVADGVGASSGEVATDDEGIVPSRAENEPAADAEPVMPIAEETPAAPTDEMPVSSAGETPAANPFDEAAHAPVAHLDRIVEDAEPAASVESAAPAPLQPPLSPLRADEMPWPPAEPSAEPEPAPEFQQADELPAPADAHQAPPADSADMPNGLAALRAVLQSLQKTAQPAGDDAQQAKKESVFRKLFKRSA